MKAMVPLDSPGVGATFVRSGTEQIADAIQNSYQDGFMSRRADLEAILDAVRGFPSQILSGETADSIDFDWHPETVDLSDNKRQLAVIKHHYNSELTHAHAIDEVMKDYCDDAVIHEVMDDVPATYHGQNGIRRSVKDFMKMLHAQDSSEEEGEGRPKVDLQHIKIHQNHAQVTWKAETPQHTQIFGTDAFTFDENNRIKSQSIVALSQEHAPGIEQK